MADVPGSSKQHGSQKKARTFDFMTMFQEARQVAIERTQAIAAIADTEQSEAETLEGKVARINTKASGDARESLDSDPSSAKEDQKATSCSNKNRSRGSRHGEADSSSSDDNDDDIVGPPLPPGFKATSSRQNEVDSEDGDDVGPSLPPGFVPVVKGNVDASSSSMSREGGRSSTSKSEVRVDSDEDDLEEEDDEEEETLQNKIPLSHKVTLSHGKKAVSALGLDPSGARLVTGSIDYNVRLWDFAGMDATLQSFRSLRPCESHQIRALEYSTTGDVILVIAGNAQAKVIDRDGFEKCECVKGDQYLVDPASTKGHTGMLNGGCWNPKIREEFMTCSIDGTVRIWDLNSPKHHKGLMRPRGQGGRRVVPTACTYSIDGRYMAAACQDGSIQLWDHNKHTFVNVAMHNKTAHVPGTDTSCLRFSYDGRVLASRGGDGTLKLWDLRKFSQPLQKAEGLFNMWPMTDCIFSPDDRMVITGVTMDKDETHGKAVFFDRESFNKVYEIPVKGASVVRFLWHPKLNQMALGCSDGKVRLYYDPNKSRRGAMLCVVRKQRKVKHAEMVLAEHIITPYALPMFREGRPTSTRKQEEKVRKDPVKSHRPELPVSGPGTGGRVGAKGATLSQYVAQTIATRKPDPYEKDPRGAILRHAKEATENPYWVDKAYEKTQPVPIYQAPEGTERTEDEDEPVWKKQKTA